MTDTLARTAGFLSIAFAGFSILYSCVIMVNFSAAKTRADGTGDEGDGQGTEGNLGGAVLEQAAPPRSRWTSVSPPQYSIATLITGISLADADERFHRKLCIVECVRTSGATCDMDCVVSMPWKVLLPSSNNFPAAGQPSASYLHSW
jgi:hypothetical protein